MLDNTFLFKTAVIEIPTRNVIREFGEIEIWN